MIKARVTQRMRLAARVVPAHGHLLRVTAGLDPAVHSARPRIWKFSMGPSRFARSQAGAGCARLPAMLSSLPRAQVGYFRPEPRFDGRTREHPRSGRGRMKRGRPHGLPGHAPAAQPGNDDGKMAPRRWLSIAKPIVSDAARPPTRSTR